MKSMITLEKLENHLSSLIGLEVVSSESLEAGSGQGTKYENIIYDELKNKFNDKIFKNYELLNFLYENNPAAISYDQRINLFQSKALRFLLSRGKKPTESWGIDSQFEEKQSDTADIIYFDNPVIILDVKSKSIEKKGQPPNIISFYKLAECCKIMLENEDFDSFDFFYIGVEFKKTSISDTISNIRVVDLFKIPMKELYFNFAAATQLQFDVDKISQNFEDTKKDWCLEFLKTLVPQVNKRIKKMEDDIKQYKDLLD